MGKRKRYDRLPDEVRWQIIELTAKGKTKAEILRTLDVSNGIVIKIHKALGGVIRRDERWEPSPARLSLDDRFEIAKGIWQGNSQQVIAARIGRHPSTVSREINANGGRADYQPNAAHRRARDAAKRPKATKLASCPRLCDWVAAELQQTRSPSQIARRLPLEFPNDRMMRVSHETIYKSLYVQGRGELRRELHRCLRTGRAKRKIRGRAETRGRIPDLVMISERPAEANDRAVPGHWEGDLIMGKAGKSAIGTLVERSTRYVLLLHLPNGFGAEAVRDEMTRIIATLPDTLKRSLTWDRGSEMAQHVRFTVDTGVPVYFCDPRSPWQRGSNENTNGLLRQFFPKGTDLSVHDRAKLDEVENMMNTRPRMTLEWKNPAEVLTEFLASTG